MIRKIIEALPEIVSSIWDSLTTMFAEMMMTAYNNILSAVSSPFSNLFNEPAIQALISFAKWTSLAAFFITVLFAIADRGEDIAGGHSTNVNEFFLDIFKGFVFTIIAPDLAIMMLQLGSILTSSLDLSGAVDITDISVVGGITSILTSPIWLLVCLIALVVFIVMTAKQYAMMLIHIATYALYTPGIVRGDSQSMGAWIRQAIAIALTFVCQYLLFYYGLFFVTVGNPILGLGLWLGLSSVSRVLNKFGLSSGFSGSSAISSVQSTMRLFSSK